MLPPFRGDNMESGSAPNGDDSPGARSQGTTCSGRLTEAERQALREGTAQARATAAEAMEHYLVLLTRSRQRLKMTEQQLVAVNATRAMLRESVQRYTQLLKALDTPPERMLSLVKETLREQVPYPAGEDETKRLVENVITWCIEAYYFGAPAA